MKLRIAFVLVWFVLGMSTTVAAQTESETPPSPDEGQATPEPQVTAEEAFAPAELPAGELGASDAAETQVEAPEGETSSVVSADSEDVIVTGTRIRRKTSFGEAAPIELVDRKQLERVGVSNVAEALQHLTVATNATASLGAAGGAAGVNLRGLGAGATLLLINGRRTNPSGTGPGAVYSDISVIPFAAVERIEVLKAGAAAIYGADAVGGVINVITRRKWSGARVQADAQGTSRWDLGEYTLSASLGAIGERSRLMAAASYFRRGELRQDRRAFSEGKLWSAQGYPAAYARIAGTPAERVPMPDPACGPLTGTTTTPFLGGAGCLFDYRGYLALVGHGERANAFASGEYDITEHVTAFGELLVSRFRGDGPLPVYSVLAPYPVVPADHVDNRFGSAVAFIGRPGAGRTSLGTVSTNDDDTLRGVVGLKGDLGGVAAGSLLADWTWEGSASIGVSRFRRTIDDHLRDALQLALDSCSDAKDLSRCYNPFYSATDGTGTANSQEVIDTFTGRVIETTDHSLQTYNAGLSGPVLALPGGELGLAVGGEWRREWRARMFDHDLRQGRFTFTGIAKDGLARRAVYSGYLELRWPFFNGFELQTAARVEHYDDTSSTPLSPFAGVSLIPSAMFGRDNTPRAFQRLQLRANASQAFRAPTIFDTYPGALTIGTALRYRPPGSMMAQTQYTPVTYLGNPNLEPETAYTFSGGFNWTPIDQLSLSADYWYYDYRNRIDSEQAQRLLDNWVRNGMLTNDPYVVVDPVTGSFGPIISNRINVAGSVVTSGIDFGVTINAFGAPTPGRPTLSVTAQGTYTLRYDVPFREASSRSLPDGMMIGPKDCTGSTDADSCSVVGKRNSNIIAPVVPRLRLNVPLLFAYAGHSLTMTGRYISGYEDDVAPMMDGTFEMVAEWVTFDIQYAYTLRGVVGKELTLRVGCQNLLDRMPSEVNGVAASYDAEVHDPRGRMLYAQLGAEF